jgi:murein DD-endopeptidase MepM/ murein hydrolase activator NlpD
MNAVSELLAIAGELRGHSQELVTLAEELGRDVEASWHYPVGNGEYPPEAWYAAALHDPSGKLNGGYAHTGIDLNVDRRPWGDVDQGEPIFAVADGVIRGLGYSQNYLGSVVIEVEHSGMLIYFRYWHLMNDKLFRSLAGYQTVRGGECLGHIGNYRLGAGGDHLHFDCAVQLFGPHWWFTRHPDVDWLDPVPILKAHLDVEQVDAMLARGVG